MVIFRFRRPVLIGLLPLVQYRVIYTGVSLKNINTCSTFENVFSKGQYLLLPEVKFIKLTSTVRTKPLIDWHCISYCQNDPIKDFLLIKHPGKQIAVMDLHKMQLFSLFCDFVCRYFSESLNKEKCVPHAAI